MKLYKLTTQDGYTRKGYDNQCLWGENITHSGTGIGDLCGPGYIHAYTSPKLAVVLNPIHANIPEPILWECEGEGEVVKSDRGLKVGCVSLTTLRKIELPIVTLEQQVRFGILCAKEVYTNPEWVQWADNWLENPITADYATTVRDTTAAYAAAYAYDAAYAKDAAAYAASYADTVRDTTAVVYAAADTVRDTTTAAVVYAATAACKILGNKLDLIKLIEEATK